MFPKKIIVILSILCALLMLGGCGKASLKDNEIYLADKSKLPASQLIEENHSEDPDNIAAASPNNPQIPTIAAAPRTTSESKGILSIPADLNPSITFADINLENLVRKAANKPSGALTQKDALNVYSITLNWESGRSESDKVSSLSGIQSLANLNSIVLRDCNISDLQPLSELKSLKSLSLDRNKVSDLSPLSGINTLEMLSLTDNRISNISGLRTLKNLRRLYIKNNPIQDFSQIAPIYTDLTSKDFSLPKPSLILPADKSIFNYTPRNLTLQWNALHGAKQYQIEVGQCLDSLPSEFANYFGSWSEEQSQSYLYNSNITQYSFEFFGARPGRWRVRPLYEGGPGEWSAWWYFKFSN